MKKTLALILTAALLALCGCSNSTASTAFDGYDLADYSEYMSAERYLDDAPADDGNIGFSLDNGRFLLEDSSSTEIRPNGVSRVTRYGNDCIYIYNDLEIYFLDSETKKSTLLYTMEKGIAHINSATIASANFYIFKDEMYFLDGDTVCRYFFKNGQCDKIYTNADIFCFTTLSNFAIEYETSDASDTPVHIYNSKTGEDYVLEGATAFSIAPTPYEMEGTN